MEKIVILDFGSQTTQLIGRRIRELNEYCEIVPYNKFPENTSDIKGVILSGSPYSVYDPSAIKVDLSNIRKKFPVLGICYGAQFMVHDSGGKVEPASSRQYGRAILSSIDSDERLFRGIKVSSQIWMSHGDSITTLPENFKKIASSEELEMAAYRIEGEKTWGVQFHPEVYHTSDGMILLENFLDICGTTKQWSPSSFIESTVQELKEQIGKDKVVLGLSGGVDSSVTALLLHKAVGKNLTCIFVDHGLLRKNEFQNVLNDYEHLGLNVIGVDAREYFYQLLAGVTDPEKKRKIIGKGFIDVFDEEAHKIKDVKWLAQGTIYPDVIESLSITGTVIKSHHNVGGLPEDVDFELLEPLRQLFKDEVREVGRELGIPEEVVERQPFPGPGLAIRCLGEVTEEKLKIIREADFVFRDEIKKAGLTDKVWQYFAALPNIRSVGVMGDVRTYSHTIALRAVTSTDGMTSDWARIPYEVLEKVSNRIVNEVDNVNRIVYDITSKPPSTIEFE